MSSLKGFLKLIEVETSWLTVVLINTSSHSVGKIPSPETLNLQEPISLVAIVISVASIYFVLTNNLYV
jgi:hypothetical protein